MLLCLFLDFYPLTFEPISKSFVGMLAVCISTYIHKFRKWEVVERNIRRLISELTALRFWLWNFIVLHTLNVGGIAILNFK